MEGIFSVEIDQNPESLAYCLRKLTNEIPDLYDWTTVVNSGGIDYGVYLNVNVNRKEIEINNQPTYGDGDDSIDDIIEFLEEDEDDI